MSAIHGVDNTNHFKFIVEILHQTNLFTLFFETGSLIGSGVLMGLGWLAGESPIAVVPAEGWKAHSTVSGSYVDAGAWLCVLRLR